jgi:group II intron reverse transcriptase/maturase
MYVASEGDTLWVLNEQRKLYKRSWESPVYAFEKLWGLVTDPRNLRVALTRVARNRGRRTAGVDGITVKKIMADGAEAFLSGVREELRAGRYQPSPVRRVLIPKPGQRGKYRPLGIPTVRDRVIQAALKIILEPIFEADFYPASYGFRPGRSAHAALEHLRMLLRPRPGATSTGEPRLPPYQWALEGDIKGCFDNINQHALMERVRRRVSDRKVTRLVVAFLKAGALSEEQFLRTDSGTPQGGILSPLLANIALGVIEERYERHVWPRCEPKPLIDLGDIVKRANNARDRDRRRGMTVMFPIRYADDFIVLVSVPPGPDQESRAREAASREKADLAVFLKERMGLELSETKTLVTPVTSNLRFLGHHVCVRDDRARGQGFSLTLLPKDRSQRLREIIKAHFRRSTLGGSLGDCLKQLNPVLRGWGYFYRHASGSKRVFNSLDNYVWETILRWTRKKHPLSTRRMRNARYGWRRPGQRGIRWRDGAAVPFRLASIRVEPYRLQWMQPPPFAQVYGEPGA